MTLLEELISMLYPWCWLFGLCHSQQKLQMWQRFNQCISGLHRIMMYIACTTGGETLNTGTQGTCTIKSAYKIPNKVYCIIRQGSPKDIPGMTCCHLWLSVRCFIYPHLMLHQIFKPTTLVCKLVLRLIWKKKSQDLDGSPEISVLSRLISGLACMQVSYVSLLCTTGGQTLKNNTETQGGMKSAYKISKK